MSRLLLMLSVILLSSQEVYSQVLDQVLNRHFEATGQEKLNDVSTLRSTGKALQMGMELPFLQIQQRPGKMYLEIDIQGTKIIQVYDGKKGWSLEPWMDPEPRELTGPELTSVSQVASIDSDLVNWREKGHKVKLEGRELLDGEEVFRIDLVKEDNVIYRFYIDADSYLINKIVTKNDFEGNSVEGETVLSDYRDIDGIMVPFRTEIRFGGNTLMSNLVDKVEFDVIIEDNIFSRP